MSQLKWRCWGLPRCSDDGADTDLGVFGIASDEHVQWLGCHGTFFRGAGATGVESFEQLGIIWEEGSRFLGGRGAVWNGQLVKVGRGRRCC